MPRRATRLADRCPPQLAETRLRQLKKQQRDKVEELKKKTGYYSTRQILEKYDEVVKKNVSFFLPPASPPERSRQSPIGRVHSLPASLTRI